MQCYITHQKTLSCIHLLQYHVVLLERAVLGTLMQDSVWYSQSTRSNVCLAALASYKHSILRLHLYIYTDFTVDSVARLHNRREEYGVILELGTTADWRDMVFVRGMPACVNC